jgi:hypothetical protein
MKKVAWILIYVIVSYFWAHGCVWVACNTPIYISIPVIWFSLSILMCIWWCAIFRLLRRKGARFITFN